MAILLLIISVSLFITVSHTQALSIEIPIVIPEIKTSSPSANLNLVPSPPTASFPPYSTPKAIIIDFPKSTTTPIPVQIKKLESGSRVKTGTPKTVYSGKPNPERVLERLKFLSQFERTRDVDKRIAVGGRRIKIATDGGKTKLIDRGVTAFVEGNIVFEKQTVNVLPADAKKKIPGAKRISLTGGDKPKYLVNREVRGKIFGRIPVQRILTDEVNTQTGEVTKQERGWWWKVFVRETGIRVDEEEACSFSGPDWCGDGLRCEVVQQGTIVPSDVGECRLYPPTVHGNIFVVTSEGQKISLHKRVKNLPGVEVSDIKTYFSKRVECGESQVTEISPDDQGNFLVNDLLQGVYDIYSLITFASDPNHPVAHPWIFSVNEGSEVSSLNLNGTNYNENNQIRILKIGSFLPLPPPPCP